MESHDEEILLHDCEDSPSMRPEFNKRTWPAATGTRLQLKPAIARCVTLQNANHLPGDRTGPQ